MRSDCCRIDGSAPAPLSVGLEKGSIPGAVHGCIPDEYLASQPIYLDGPMTLEQFLSQSEVPKNNLDMNPPASDQESFLWPVTSRFSFVSAVFIALLTALTLCANAQASEENACEKMNAVDSSNVKIAAKTDSIPQADGLTISFVCGRPNTLQVLAPMDLPDAKAARVLPQGASPIAEMKYMPAAKQNSSKNMSVRQSVSTKPDAAANERIYQRLMRLSLADPAVYKAEGSSLITYFSILTGGHDQSRVDELEKILEKNLLSK